MASLPLLQPRPLEDAGFLVEPQAWPGDKSLRRLELELEAEPLAEFESVVEHDPAPAGPISAEVKGSDWVASPASWPDAEWDAPGVRLPDSSQSPVRVGSLAVCGAGPSLAAEPVEAFLLPSRAAGVLPYPARVPEQVRFALKPIDWEIAAKWAKHVPAKDAEPVESFLPPSPEPQIFAWPSALTLPRLTLIAAEWLNAAALAEPLPAPGAQPVESFLPAPADPKIAAWPANAAASPRFNLSPAAWRLSVDLAGPVAAPAAEAVESLLQTIATLQFAAWQPTSALLPPFAIKSVEWTIDAAIAEPVNAPPPEAVESFLPALPTPEMIYWPLAHVQLPPFAIQPADWAITGAIAEPAEAPSAQAVESLLPPALDPSALPLPVNSLRLAQFTLSAIAPEPIEEFVAPVVIADASQNWMPGPPACEAVRDVIPAYAGPLPASIEVIAPAVASLVIEQPFIRRTGNWRPSAMAEPVISYIAPRLAPALPAYASVAALGTGDFTRAAAQRAENLAAASECYPEAAEPASPEAPRTAAAYTSGSRTLRLPTLVVEYTSGNRAAPFQVEVPPAVEPAIAGPNPGSAALQLDRASTVQPPSSPVPVLRCGLPMAKAVGVDFICQRTPAAPAKTLQSIAIALAVYPPKFVVRPIFERIEEAVALPKPQEKTPAFAEIFEITKAARKTSATRTGLFSAGKLVAASLIVGLSMWFGAGSAKISRQLIASNGMREIGSTNTSSGVETVASNPTGSFPSPKDSAPKPPSGPIAAVRRAIQSRSAVEFTDTFKRMEVWGSNAMTLPRGWTRNSDGYVRTGELALYHPAQSFVDYHFEFFGQIEKKGMSWAVRARDPQNYYGMKMTVIEPGLRPVVAMVHYAVVGGKKGRSVATPLSMMMHNDEPYHVSVDVKGNHVITSIEGQEVDSWTADVLKAGGVGFFSEVGESARLYWMRVSKNQDWLGRVCAYLSSGSGTNTAELWRDEFPQVPAQPPEPALPSTTDVTVAAVDEAEDFSEMSPQRARIFKIGRTELCRS